MSEIERILNSGESHRILVAVPSRDDLRAVSAALGVALPPSYVEFCLLGGLGELRFSSRILDPKEIVAEKRYVREQLLPFASNGCGDFYCWLLDGSAEPAVVFLDHEEEFRETPAAASFTALLAKNRF
jgi:SMI1 / KNR4 family (SUKH-1)